MASYTEENLEALARQGMEIYDWKSKLEEKKEIGRLQEEKDTRRLEKAKSLENGWEMLRWCKKFLKENTKTWQTLDDERKTRLKKEEIEERKLIASEKKGKLLEKLKIQTKITDSLKMLPADEQRKFNQEENRRKRQELKEIKENLWRKWRGGKKVSEKKYGKEKEAWERNLKDTAIENVNLDRLEKTLEAWKMEEENRIEKRKEIERKLEIVEEGKRKQLLEKEKEKEEKKQRLERKKKLEEHWKMIRWVTAYLDQNENEMTNIAIEVENRENKTATSPPLPPPMPQDKPKLKLKCYRKSPLGAVRPA